MQTREPQPPLPRLIARMCERDFYPHPTAGQIEVMETHISYVLLTGPYAYKVKKPVTLTFLDFGTLEQRHHFCLEELRLNRRGAPEIYLDVVAITRDGEDLQLGGAGPVVEYAVKMRQFPQGNLFSNRLAAGRIGPADVVALARALADHHAGARTDRVIAEFATPERVRRAVDDVYAAAGRYVGGPLQPRARYEQTRAFTDAFLIEFADLLRARAAAGRVRECHGDVHLGNVCLDAGRVLLIDCIEFSEALRFLDVMNDAAFPAMDLRAKGRADLATLFVNAYAESTGDWEGLRMLPFYLCSRAYVRAMVHSLLSDEPGLRPDQVSHARAGAERYYGLAWEYTRPAQGRLLLVCGAPGSGKSTVACELAQRAGAIHIRSDAVRKHLAGVPLHARAGAELYVPAMTRRTYARLLELGVMLAGAGFRVILDATFNRRETRGQAVARARTLGIDVRILRCVAPAEVMRARVAERRGDVSDATPQLLDRSPASFDSLTPDEERRARRVNTTREFDRGDLARWAFAEDAVSGSSEV